MHTYFYISYPAEPNLGTNRCLQKLSLSCYHIATVVLYTANVKIIQKYAQMCFGGHLGFEAIQHYANPELLFVVIQYCTVFQI